MSLPTAEKAEVTDTNGHWARLTIQDTPDSRREHYLLNDGNYVERLPRRVCSIDTRSGGATETLFYYGKTRRPLLSAKSADGRSIKPPSLSDLSYGEMMATQEPFWLDPREVLTRRDNKAYGRPYQCPPGSESQLWLVPPSVSRYVRESKTRNNLSVAPSAHVSCQVFDAADSLKDSRDVHQGKGCIWRSGTLVETVLRTHDDDGVPF
jgi:hypothetical protein